MSLVQGSQPVVGAYAGDREIVKIMQGDGYVWPAEPPAPLTRTSRFFLTLADSQLKQTICFWQDVAGAVEIDWGDGSTVETVQSADFQNTSHTYAAAGNYVILITVQEEHSWAPGGAFVSFLDVFGSKSDTSPQLTAVSLGNGLFFGNNSQGGYAFLNCTSLTELVVPPGITMIPGSFASGCTGIQSVSIPDSVVDIQSSAFQNNTALGPNLELRSAQIGHGAFRACTSLRKVWLRNSVTELTVNETVSSGTVTARSGPFSSCSDQLVIYCEADEKPAGWDTYWAVRTGTDTLHSVVWGQKVKPW